MEWLDEIIGNVVVYGDPSSHDNLYYTDDKKTIKFFKEMLSRIALWSNVLNQKFNSANICATSSDVESYFNTIKNLIFKKKINRPDKFIIKHIDFISSEMKISLAKTQQTKPTKGNSTYLLYKK